MKKIIKLLFAAVLIGLGVVGGFKILKMRER